MELEIEIAAADFAVTHPELQHYTDLKGLRGILASNTLWATHFSHLNDSTEVMLLQQPLTDALATRALAQLQSATAINRHTRRRIEKEGGGPQVLARDFVAALFGAAFKGPTAAPLAEPYITSFCAHTTVQSYEIENGLLSQWRAYGGGTDRYCIVFDTARMIELLAREFDSHYWTYMRLDEVHYALGHVPLDKLFPELIGHCESDFIRALSGDRIQISRETIVNLLSEAPRFKHQGFKEEQEVRVIAIPGTQLTLDKTRSEHPGQIFSPLKSILTRAGTTGGCRYVALFDGLDAELPIKRIIVGPSRNQDDSLAKARVLFDGRSKLTRSETPFIG